MDKVSFFRNSSGSKFKYGDSITPEQCGRLIDLFEVYDDSFVKVLEGGVSSISKFPIKTTSTQPIFTKSRLTDTQNNLLRQKINELLEAGYLKPSTSKWSSPVEPKMIDNEWEICVNYSALNSITIAKDFSIPRIPDVLSQIGSSSYYTRIKIINAFHQLGLEPNSTQKTAFTCDFGQFEFTSYTLGLKNAPNYLQWLMEKILEKFINTNCSFVLYLGNVLIFEKNPQRHLDLFEDMLECFRRANLKLEVNKCCFMCRRVYFLGMIVGPEGISIDPTKLQKIADTEFPTNKAQLRTFLGLTNQFRNYVANYDYIAQPLQTLTGPNIPFVFDIDAQTAFQKIKDRILKAPPMPFT